MHWFSLDYSLFAKNYIQCHRVYKLVRISTVISKYIPVRLFKTTTNSCTLWRVHNWQDFVGVPLVFIFCLYFGSKWTALIRWSSEGWSTHRSVGTLSVSMPQIDRSVQPGWAGMYRWRVGRWEDRSQELKSPRIKTGWSTDHTTASLKLSVIFSAAVLK